MKKFCMMDTYNKKEIQVLMKGTVIDFNKKIDTTTSSAEETEIEERVEGCYTVQFVPSDSYHGTISGAKFIIHQMTVDEVCKNP
jgi:hypothetical protein